MLMTSFLSLTAPERAAVRVPAAAELISSLELEGYIPGPPTHLRSWARSVDADVAESLTCDSCGRAGMIYKPFHRPVGAGAQYRAVCQCPVCPAGFEM